MTIEFLITALIVVIAPGTGALYTIATGLGAGRRASLIAAFACTLGIIPHMLAAITGLAAVLHTSAIAFQGLKIAGVAYLLYLAWQIIRDTGSLTLSANTHPRSGRHIIRQAILINLLNPKLSIFFLAFLPQFIDPAQGSPIPQMIELSAIFMAMTFVVFAAYGVCAAAMRDHVLSRPRVLKWMRRSFAGAFVSLSARLALAEQ